MTKHPPTRFSLGSGSNDANEGESCPTPGQWQRRALWGPALIVCLMICFAAAAIGSAFTVSSLASWYPTLVKPAWNPPDWVFGPVWTVLYFMMAVSAWLVWQKWGLRSAALPLGVFAAQLVLNVLWSVVFFGYQNPGGAVVEVAVFWLAIAATIAAFWRVDRLAALLLVPYLLWVSFAAVLNLAVWQLNR